MTTIVSASLAMAKISLDLVLFDMRNQGLSLANAAFAGSSQGKTLSVTAITGPAIAILDLKPEKWAEKCMPVGSWKVYALNQKLGDRLNPGLFLGLSR